MSHSINDDDSEDSAERALRVGLRAPVLSAEALHRIRGATQIEWRAAVAPALRRWPSLAAVAAVALLASAVVWNVFFADSAPNSGAVLGELARSDAPGVVELHGIRGDFAVPAGSSLRVGHPLEIRGDALVTLAGGGNLRVTRASTVEVLSAGTVKLDRGELYVDIPPGGRGKNSFVVLTPAGEFRHIGTQFALAIINGQTRLRVREGSVQWHASEGDSTVNAGTEVMIDRNRASKLRPISNVGREWAWAELLAPEIEIEDRPLLVFLEWFSRETGRRLVIPDDHARRQVASIRMHGNVHGLTAMEALSAVMAATTLSFELPGDTIRVSSARESTPPSS